MTEALYQHRIIGSVEAVGPRPAVRFPEQGGAKCLRGVRDPELITIECLPGVAALDQFDRLPHRESGRGRPSLRRRQDHRRYHLGCDQRPGAIVHNRDGCLVELREPSVHRVLPVRASGHNRGHFAQSVFGQQDARPVDIRCADDHHDLVDERR